MREIKFRAWDKLNKEMFDVEIINFQERRVYKDTVSYRKFEDIELMQYTGLKDKNNKEIYEGDVLFESFGERYYKVVFENGSFRAEFEGDFEEYSFDLIDVVAQGCKIVGNIYENPELLKVIE
ncbi:YopX family protein [Fusobacterium polymorphum]|uniref:YopX family protein n=1 Tax=Fusobacterium nucleatum subsp. polymorphum TaxID=76857 RepID=UPI00300A6583